MNLNLYVFLKTVHIVAGVLWVGAAVSYLFFVKPSIKELGPATPKFVESLIRKRRFPIYMMTISILTVLAGSVLFYYTSGGLSMEWLQSGMGIGLTIGSIAGLVAFVAGNFWIGPLTEKLGALGEEIARAGTDPLPEQLGKMQMLERRLSRAEWVDFSMLVVSVLSMSLFRYIAF